MAWVLLAARVESRCPWNREGRDAWRGLLSRGVLLNRKSLGSWGGSF